MRVEGGSCTSALRAYIDQVVGYNRTCVTSHTWLVTQVRSVQSRKSDCNVTPAWQEIDLMVSQWILSEVVQRWYLTLVRDNKLSS